MTALRYMICMLLAAGSLSSTAEITQTRLGTQVAAPLRGASEKIWNLSTVIADEEAGVSYRVYGDTVVSEEYDAIRCWYATDSQGLLRMESSLWRVDPLAPVGAGVWAPISAEATENFNGAIARESMPDDTLACSLTRQADMAGLVVLPGPDTLRAVLRSEAIGVRDAGGEYVRETRRWFAAGDSRACPVPVAMAVTQTYGGKLLSEVAFVADKSEWPDAVAAEPDLDALHINVSGGRLTISSSTPLEAEVSIDITDLTGRSYLYATIPAGGSSATLDLSPLPAGQYLAVLTAGHQSRKVKISPQR